MRRLVLQMQTSVDGCVEADRPDLDWQKTWPRTRLVQRPLADAVAQLKNEPGADIIAFGGVRFATSLAAAGLVDEFQFYVNPTAVGAGRSVLAAGTRLVLEAATAYDCGVTVLRYRPERAGAPGDQTLSTATESPGT